MTKCMVSYIIGYYRADVLPAIKRSRIL